jgi:predicted amidophosphoribosyltransferase
VTMTSRADLSSCFGTLPAVRRIAYASCYVYSPAGNGAVCELSRMMRTSLKAGNAALLRKFASRVRQQAADARPLAGFFGSTDVLVPVPGSTPLSAPGMWAAEQVVAALLKEGLGRTVWPGLRRAWAVPKSATAPRGERPTMNLHYESFRVERAAISAEKFLLVDDVITKGSTMLAAANRLHEAFPRAQIAAFALIRTMGMIDGVQKLLNPCMGEICWRWGDVRRSP